MRTRASAQPVATLRSEGAGRLDGGTLGKRLRGWRGRFAVLALVGVSVGGYVLAFLVIDALTHGQAPLAF